MSTSGRVPQTIEELSGKGRDLEQQPVTILQEGRSEKQFQRRKNPQSTPVKCDFMFSRNGSERVELFAEDFSPQRSSNPLKTRLEYTNDGNMLLIITNWKPWFLAVLKDAVPSFPSLPVLSHDDVDWTTTLPSLSLDLCDMSCVMEHVHTVEEVDSNANVFRIGSTKVQCLPIVVWASRSGIPRRNVTSNSSGIIVVISTRSGNIVDKLKNYYRVKSEENWKNLMSNQTWIYLDLALLFTEWGKVWVAVKRNIDIRADELYKDHTFRPIMGQTKKLHQDNRIILSLQEHLRSHKASLNVIIRRLQSPSQAQGMNPLAYRFDTVSQVLDYYDVTSTSLLNQQQNLLSLAFNIETVRQGQSATLLNLLAFTFIPLGYVASVFGITTFTTEAKWYPVYAVPLLLATWAVYLLNILFRKLHTRKRPTS